MARKVKFPLELRDGYLARSNIEEVRAHFDLEKIRLYSRSSGNGIII